MPWLSREEMIDLWTVMRIVRTPEKFGCRFDQGDPETYQERVGWIMDDAMKIFDKSGVRSSGE